MPHLRRSEPYSALALLARQAWRMGGGRMSSPKCSRVRRIESGVARKAILSRRRATVLAVEDLDGIGAVSSSAQNPHSRRRGEDLLRAKSRLTRDRLSSFRQ
jgi:hypothetical protein